MRIGDELLFAPDITFSKLDLSGKELPSQLKKRIDFFFLEPAGLLLEKCFPFAAGTLLVSCIDSLAKIRYSSNSVGVRFKKWCKEELISFNDERSTLFYEDFRNGLVHEARIKNGGEFNLGGHSVVESYGNSLRINPRLLHKEVINAFGKYLKELEGNKSSRTLLVKWIMKNFDYELKN